MKTKIFLFKVAALCSVIFHQCAPVEPSGDINLGESVEKFNPDSGPSETNNEEDTGEVIQLAILLDTSNSMDGLIDQAKNQLWDIVNKVTSAKNPNGQFPQVRVALYHYGNDKLSMMDNYIEKISDFTGELDQISQELFSLTTNGGEEYCGAVTKHSINNLEWSKNEEGLKMIFIAGNEAFDQGPISFKKSCVLAAQQNIIINTIFCGNYQEGVNTNWAEGAALTEGKFFNINSDATAVHIDSPYDSKIIELNEEFNGTYLYFGAEGRSKKALQLDLDDRANEVSEGYLSKRIISKNSKAYANHLWDVVDAYAADSTMVISELEGLSEEYKDKTEEELQAIVKLKTEKRNSIKSEIADLKVKRLKFVSLKKEELKGDDNQLEDAVLEAIEDQAKSAGYVFGS